MERLIVTAIRYSFGQCLDDLVISVRFIVEEHHNVIGFTLFTKNKIFNYITLALFSNQYGLNHGVLNLI